MCTGLLLPHAMSSSVMSKEHWMSVTTDELSAFHGTVRHGGVNKAAKIMSVRAKVLIERRRSLAEGLNRTLFIGEGPGWKLTADGQQLYDWIDSFFPSGVELAALELNKHGWSAIEPPSATPDAHDDPDALEEPSSIQPPPRSTPEPSRLKVRVEVPEHPKLAKLVTEAIVWSPAVAGTVEFIIGGPWPSAVERLVTGDIDIAFGWSPGDRPDGYPPTLKAQRLMTDNFDHAIERRGFWHRVLPGWARVKIAVLRKLRKHPMAMLGRSVQQLLDEHIRWFAGKWMIVIDPPSDKHRRNAWMLASRYSNVIRPDELSRPLDIFGLKAGFDVVYRVDEKRTDTLAMINGTIAHFDKDTEIDPSPVRAKFILSPSAQDLASAEAVRAHLRAQRVRWKS